MIPYKTTALMLVRPIEQIGCAKMSPELTRKRAIVDSYQTYTRQLLVQPGYHSVVESEIYIGIKMPPSEDLS